MDKLKENVGLLIDLAIKLGVKHRYIILIEDYEIYRHEIADLTECANDVLRLLDVTSELDGTCLHTKFLNLSYEMWADLANEEIRTQFGERFPIEEDFAEE